MAEEALKPDEVSEPAEPKGEAEKDEEVSEPAEPKGEAEKDEAIENQATLWQLLAAMGFLVLLATSLAVLVTAIILR